VSGGVDTTWCGPWLETGRSSWPHKARREGTSDPINSSNSSLSAWLSSSESDFSDQLSIKMQGNVLSMDIVSMLTTIRLFFKLLSIELPLLSAPVHLKRKRTLVHLFPE
jgi:hypothetical protein